MENRRRKLQEEKMKCVFRDSETCKAMPNAFNAINDLHGLYCAFPALPAAGSAETPTKLDATKLVERTRVALDIDDEAVGTITTEILQKKKKSYTCLGTTATTQKRKWIALWHFHPESIA